MNVIVKNVGKPATIYEIKGDELEALTKLVGGRIEMYPSPMFGGPEDAKIYMNEGGRQMRLTHNVCGILGNFVVTGPSDDNGDTQPLTEVLSSAVIKWLADVEENPSANYKRMKDYDRKKMEALHKMLPL